MLIMTDLIDLSKFIPTLLKLLILFLRKYNYNRKQKEEPHAFLTICVVYKNRDTIILFYLI